MHSKLLDDVIKQVQHEDYQPSEVLSKYIPFGTFSEDRDGSPLYILIVGNLDIAGLMNSATTEEILTFFVYQCEKSAVLRKHLSEKYGKEITSCTLLFDLENFRFRDSSSKPVFELFLEILNIFKARYQKWLKKALIINAPAIFSLFWTMTKPFVSEKARKRVFIYGKDNWKEAIFGAIDPDHLPKHWGGNGMDPVSGNPYCSPKICLGGEIPDSYYLTNRKLALWKDAKSVVVPSGGTVPFRFAVKEAGSTLSWSFQTESHDVAFGVLFSSNQRKLDLIPVSRKICEKLPEKGSLVCQKAGTYTLVFDNSYSWCVDKKVYYDMKITSPREPS